MPCYSPLKGYRDAVTGGLCFDRQLDSKGCSLGREEMEVPCGQCLGCRLDRARMWTARITHEASLYEFGRGNSFITLTYEDEFLPTDWSLKKRDFQLFMKRLRKFFDRDPGDGIRFYMCGEYGDICKHSKSVSECDFCNVGRPHYHAILFNVDFDDKVFVSSRDEYSVYESDTLNELWEMGFCHIGSVTAESAGYVARYCLKKITGVNADDYYSGFDTYTGECLSVQPEYSTMSRKPGIAKVWFEKYYADVFESDEVPIVGKGVLKGVPRYYDNLMEVIDADVLDRVKSRRIEYRNDNAEEYTAERLMSKYTVKNAQIKQLKRE